MCSNLLGALTNGSLVSCAMRLAKALANLRFGIQAGADRGAALRQRIKLALRRRESRDRRFHLRRIAGKFLAERERRCIHGVGAADLDDLGEFLGLLVERALQAG